MKFNDTKDTIEERTRSTNRAGGQSYDPDSPELELYKFVVNNMLENTYYRDDRAAVLDVDAAFSKVARENPQFALELAAHARNEMGNRDVAVLLYVLAANDDRFTPEDPGAVDFSVRDYGPRILRRMDEPATALAVHDYLIGGTAPKALKKGIADAIDQMLEPDYNSGAYRLQKYTQANREVNLWDSVNRSHVRRYAQVPDDGYKHELLTQLMEGHLPEHDANPLPRAETWENVVSREGGTAEAWRKALSGDHSGTSRGMGIMARVKNIRNMLDAGLTGDEIFGEDELERVRHSRMFPFRLYTAYMMYKRDIDHRDPHVEEFLEEAIQITVGNVPDTWEDTAVGIDLSGSMDNGTISEHSVVRYSDLSTFFGGVMASKGAHAFAFAKDTIEIDQSLINTPALEIMNKIQHERERIDTGGTNAWAFMKELTEMDRSFDRIVFLTDMQCWDDRRMVGGGAFNRSSGNEQTIKEWVDTYRDEHGQTAIYTIDLSSYGDLMLPEGYENVYRISGWNDRILNFVEHAEEPGQIIDEINA